MALNTSFHPRVKGSVTFDQGNCAASTTTTSSAQTLKGARTDMAFYVSRPSGLDAGLTVCDAFCDSADTIKFVFMNATTGGINPSSLTFDVIGW